MYEWDESAGDWVDNSPVFSIENGLEQLSGPTDTEPGFVDYSGYGNLTGPELAQLAKTVEANQGGATFSGLLSQYGTKALDLLKTDGAFDPLKLAKLGLGAYAASQPNTPTPTGYQGKIPKYTATTNMLTAPPAGRVPGSGGINYGGGVTYRNPAGNVVSSNEMTLEELRRAAAENLLNQASRPVVQAAKGGLVSDGFVVPADVVSHLGNGSSEAGLKLLASKFGAEPIKGDGDGMSDSIPTKIDGVQEARVANEEAFISPEMVERIGNGDSEKGAKKLYAMMDKIREDRTGTKKQGKQIEASKYMPGGSVDRYALGGTTTAPAGVTGSESSLSNWAGDYVTDMLGRGSALAQAPYQAYTGPLTAGPSDLQGQAFKKISDFAIPSSVKAATGLAGDVGARLYAAPEYQGATFANQYKAPDIGTATQFQNQYVAPTDYQSKDFTAGIFGTPEAQQYMNPYLETALRPQLAEMQRASDIARLADASRLTQAGAYGGSRQAIMESEARRNLLGKQSDVLGQGYMTAYDKATQQFNADQARQMEAQRATEQSRQFGAGQAATTADLQAKYGLSTQQAQEMARQFQSGQAMTAAELQARYGLSAQQAQEASRQFGANLGLQRLQAATQAAQTQGQLGIQEGQLDLAGINALANLGAAQRGISSEGIAADKAQFEEARLNPYKMLQFEQSLLSGLPLASQSYTMPAQSNLQQFASGTQTAQQLLDILSGKSATPAATPAKT